MKSIFRQKKTTGQSCKNPGQDITVNRKKYISQETIANWQRLQTDPDGRLLHGANKTKSEKHIIPVEYFSNGENIVLLEKILHICREKKLEKRDILHTFASLLLEKENILHKEHVQKVLSAYGGNYLPFFTLSMLPEGEKDILGFLYQMLLSEGEKNTSGAYYTPQNTVEELLKGYVRDKNTLFLDPCCGSGAFLLSDIFSSPEQLWGCDSDIHAVFIARINLLCKYKEHIFSPNIFCCDFLTEKTTEKKEDKTGIKKLFHTSFTLIATNPPWGAVSTPFTDKNADIFRESFSAFFVKSFQMLKENGSCAFLFPESILKIRKHENIRKYILQNTLLEKILFPSGNIFTSVMTKQVMIHTKKSPAGKEFCVIKNGKKSSFCVKDFLEKKECSFSFPEEEISAILSCMQKKKKYDLSGSIFALGIVTGDNKRKVSKKYFPGMEKVYTGKEIFPYMLAPAKNYLFYTPESFQQTAKEEYYRMEEKLVYKFISHRLVFALDNTKSLFLNSANILIPRLPRIHIKTLLAILNSKVMNFYYIHTFGDLKILKKNLLLLPLPEVSREEDKEICSIVENILEKKVFDGEVLERKIASLYSLTEAQFSCIHKSLSFLQKKSCNVRK